MNRKEINIEELVQALDERRAVLRSRLRVQGVANENANPDRADLAQDYFLENRRTALQDRMEGTLEQVEEALNRIDAGKYGKCQNCGEDISTGRLLAIPYAELCIQCQEKTERN